MPTFISLVNWTDQGIRNFKETASRAAAAKELARRMGGEMKEIYWTLGQYDIVAVADFPDDETGTAFLLALGSQGNTRTNSMRAFSESELTGILDKVG
jgi:uncharacterized protein with GYD domain